MRYGSALSALSGLTLLGSASLAQADEAPAKPPAVTEDAGGPAQKGKTEAAEEIEAGKRKEGWSPGIALGVGFNLIDTRHVVGQQDGTTITLSGALDASLELSSGIHEWRNGLLASAGTARTPSIDEFFKTNDGLSFETIYLLHLTEILGPFARFGLDTQMLSATDIRAAPVRYQVAMLDGTTAEYTGRRLALTDPFEPLTLKESIGAFVQPIRRTEFEFEARAGFGAQETWAEGGLAITDDADTDVVEVKELDDSYQVGVEVVLNAWGFFDPGKRISYTAGFGVLFPFVTSALPEGDDRNLGELTTVEIRTGLNAKLFDWASLSYHLSALRQPLVVDEWQVSNSVLLTIGAAFGSKAPEEPKKEKCDCAEPAEVVPQANKPEAPKREAPKPEAAAEPAPKPEVTPDDASKEEPPTAPEPTPDPEVQP